MVEHLRWGVLGAAEIAREAVIPAIQASTNGRVTAIASRDPTRATEFARAFAIEHVSDSYDALLDRSDIDAVYIPLPNSLHAEWSIRAAEAGKAVLCEKPIATDTAEAQRVAEACSRLGVPLMEGFMYRFHPQTARAREIVRTGAIGELREVRAHLSVNFMQPPDPANVRLQKGLGGGTLLDMGCYTSDIARMFFAAEPVSVTATWRMDERFGVDVTTTGVLEFQEGYATMSCSFAAGGQGSYVLVGTQGQIEMPRGIIPGLGTRAAEAIIVVVDADGHRREERFAPADQYRLMAEAFARAAMTGGQVALSPADSIRNMRVLDAWARAASSGVTEKIAGR